MNESSRNQKGYIALIAILIIMIVTLGIGLSLNVLSIGETRGGLLKQQSAQSFALADSCLQEAYLQIKRDNNYLGGDLNIEQGSCTITVVKQGQSIIVTIESNINNIIRKIESELKIDGNNLVINYWQELN